MLNYPSVAAFAQHVRQQHRALQDDEVLLVVEGSTDCRALRQLLIESVILVPARGRNLVLGAYEELRQENLAACLFLADCDNNFPSDLKGLTNLVITSNRDLEADLLFALNGYERIVLEFLGGASSRTKELLVQRDEVLSYCATFVSAFGIVKDAARSRGLTLRIADPLTAQRVRSTISDLPQAAGWIGAGYQPSIDEIAADLGHLLGWTALDVSAVAVDANRTDAEPCRRHAVVACVECRRRCHCNGHDMVSAIALDLSARLTLAVSQEELDKHLRIAADRSLVPRWSVGRRMRRWEEGAKARLLRV